MSEQVFDVLIVGSGHTGGMAAKILTEQGIRCLMLNAGPVADVVRDAERKPAYELPYRGFRPPDRVPHVFQASEFDANVWVDEKEVPYTFDPGKDYNWVRVRLFGGRSLFWARQSYRFSDYEFKGKSHDGFDEDWPISYADLAPYYSRCEEILQVTGAHDSPPQMPDGNFVLENTPWSPSMQRFIAAAKPRGMSVCKFRRAMGRDGLASSVNLLLPDAEKTGNLTSIANAVVREITVDKNTGQPNGCIFVDRLTGREMTVKARIVVLAAGTLESTRLLLNSGNLSNSSGLVGHYLTDHISGAGVVCSVPEARNGNWRAIMGGGAMVPRFRNITTRSDKFIRGYAIAASSSMGGLAARNFTAYGEELDRKIKEYFGSGFYMALSGESLSYYQNHVRINPNKVDAWGIPVLHIDAKHSDNDNAIANDFVETCESLADASGFEVLAKNTPLDPPGYTIHEVGTCRMGNDPKRSVLNQWCQSHDHKNLFIVDGACFVSIGWQNPTLTMLALSMRASEYLAGEMKRQNL